MPGQFDYDTRPGIVREYLKDGLAGLHRLSKHRGEAGYGRRERLEWWCVNGIFVLDESGNFSVIAKAAPYDRAREDLIRLAEVMSRDETIAVCPRLEYSLGNALPPLNDICPRCLYGWDMKNVRDYVYSSPDDYGSHKAHHRECWKYQKTELARGQFEMAFIQAGYDDPDLLAIPNEYCSCDLCAPWFLANTKEIGLVRIGWRKSVINIDWSKSQKAASLDGMVIFHDIGGITHAREHVHAYGYEKAAEYLGRLRMIA